MSGNTERGSRWFLDQGHVIEEKKLSGFAPSLPVAKPPRPLGAVDKLLEVVFAPALLLADIFTGTHSGKRKKG